MAKEKDMFDYDEIMKHIQQVNEQTQSAMDDMFKRSEEIAKKADAEAKEKRVSYTCRQVFVHRAITCSRELNA